MLRDPAHLRALGFKTDEAECFALGSKVEVEELIFTSGGGAVNAAVSFARQGLKTGAIVKVGDDYNGKSIIELLKRERITPYVSSHKTMSTGYSAILLTGNGERTILVYRGASETLQKKEVPFRKLQNRWAYVAPGGISPALIEEVMRSIKKNGGSVALNPSKHYLQNKGVHVRRLLPYADVVIVNREEASYLTGVDYREYRKLFKAFDGLIDGIAVVTDGALGARVSDGRYVYSAGVFKEKKLVDRTGAGDAFGSGFIAGLIQKQDIHYALRVAAANATSVVEYIGAHEGILRKKDLANRRWKYLDLDIEPL